MNRTLGLALGLVALFGTAACSSSERIGSATTTSDTGVTTTIDSATTTSTTDGAATTVVATTVAEPATTAAPPTTVAAPSMPTLRGNGIGTIDFGGTDDAVLELLTPWYGGVSSDTSMTLPVNENPDLWTDEFGETAFVTPVVRTVCFVNTVCTYFGGTDAPNLTFLGWEINGEASPEPSTIEGIMIGDRWNVHAASMSRDPGGCYTYGYGTTLDGIEVGMISSGEQFNFYDDSTATWVDGNPNPADVTIVYLSAGDQVFSLFEDC